MKILNISDETYELIKDQLKGNESMDVSKMEDFVGKKVYIRTVTFHHTGKIEKIVGQFLLLSSAAWIADSGRFMQAIKDGVLNEVEPVGEVFVNVNTIVDMFYWRHPLPTEQK